MTAPISTNTGKTYPAHDALWHLVTMGVLDADHRPNGWTPPAEDARKTRVAVIDTSVAISHPNLTGAIQKPFALDLFSARLGSFAAASADDLIGDLHLADVASVVQDLPHSQALLTEFTARLAAGQRAWHRGVRPAVSEVFSAHGTAICGLIGARPVEIPASTNGVPGAAATQVLPYCGVDPFCEIVPISTNFDSDPEALILAFLYAELIGADVIHLPRVIPDPARTQPELSAYVLDDVGGQSLGDLVCRTPVSATEKELWDELLELIVRISIRRPVVCAAGNANEEYGVYPANFAAEDNGIISVGAVNAKGWNCSYSPMHNLTVWAPSSDAERYDRTEVRQDERRHDYDPTVIPVPNANAKFSHFDVISTDVPGLGGYAAGPHDYAQPPSPDGIREFGSYFCRFGGTSAASAQIAGFLSLGRTIGLIEDHAGGIGAKAWLMGLSSGLGADHGGMVVPALVGAPKFPDQ